MHLHEGNAPKFQNPGEASASHALMVLTPLGKFQRRRHHFD